MLLDAKGPEGRTLTLLPIYYYFLGLFFAEFIMELMSREVEEEDFKARVKALYRILEEIIKPPLDGIGGIKTVLGVLAAAGFLKTDTVTRFICR